MTTRRGNRVGPGLRRQRASRVLVVALAHGIGLALAGCEGQGDDGAGLVIRNAPIAERCTPGGRPFPSGLAVLSEAVARAALVQSEPPGLLVYGIEAPEPVPFTFVNIGTDSDGDGRDDAAAMAEVSGRALRPTMGGIRALDDGLALVSTSNYEQVLFADPSTGAPIEVAIEVPGAIPPERFPLLPPPGSAASRTGLSTLACVAPTTDVDSSGRPIEPEPRCDADAPSYRTTLTAGASVAGGRLFVATSNLLRGSRFLPGTVLVFDWETGPTGITVRPVVEPAMLFTTGFNPTGVARVVTPGGRELVLVTVTGVIGSGSGAGNVQSDAAIDVIDPVAARLVATIPLERAGPAFDAPAVDAAGRIAWLGASSQRQLYAVDLRALDAPGLLAGGGPPVVLDGATTGFPDARVFDGDRPLVLPARGDGRAGSCEGFTHVALNRAASEVFATDFCDGTFTRVRLDLAGDPPIPYPRERFQVAGQSAPFAPNDAIGELRTPGELAVRQGVPGVDFTTPDVLVLAGQPDGHLCALRVESP
ncbi:MAG: hypothetical protein R3F35_16625 [Myxococcota bacterium]